MLVSKRQMRKKWSIPPLSWIDSARAFFDDELFAPLVAVCSDLRGKNNGIEHEIIIEKYLFYFIIKSSLPLAEETLLREDVVTVRDEVVRELGEADVLVDDNCCSFADDEELRL